MNRMSLDSEYMTFEEFIERMKKDLNESDFSVIDCAAPNNEEDYQKLLELFQSIK